MVLVFFRSFSYQCLYLATFFGNWSWTVGLKSDWCNCKIPIGACSASVVSTTRKTPRSTLCRIATDTISTRCRIATKYVSLLRLAWFDALALSLAEHGTKTELGCHVHSGRSRPTMSGIRAGAGSRELKNVSIISAYQLRDQQIWWKHVNEVLSFCRQVRVYGYSNVNIFAQLEGGLVLEFNHFQIWLWHGCLVTL